MSEFQMDDMVDKIKGTASKITKNVIDKTGSTIEVAKLNFTLGNLDEKMNSQFEKIGKLIYEQYKNDDFYDESIDCICRDIDVLASEAEEIKEKISREKNCLICPACGEYVSKNDIFCPKCGEKMTK